MRSLFSGLFGATTEKILQRVSDQDTSLIDKDGLQKYLEFFPAGNSFKCLDHFRQLTLSGKFAKYKSENHLGPVAQEEPPEYDISEIKGCKISLICGKGDLLAGPADYYKVYEELKAENDVEFQEFPHGHVALLMPENPKQPTITMLACIVGDY